MHGRSPSPGAGTAAAGAAVVLGALAILLSAPAPAHAICSVLSHQPCTPYVPSVLRRHPFTPYSCGVLHGPCLPQVVLVEGEEPVLRITGHDGPPQPPDRDHRLEALADVAEALSQCLALPPDADQGAGVQVVSGMQVSVKLAFKRDGALMPAQRFVYTTRGAPDSVKAAWHTAVMEMLTRCAPLPLSDALGGAIAGRPLIVAVTDVRGAASDGAVPVLRITGHDGPAQPPDPEHRLEALTDVAQALSQCLEPPPGAAAPPGMAVEVRLAFKRNGELLPVQRFAYAGRGASGSAKAAWHAAIVDMLTRCTPLPLSDDLGGAIAGRPLTLAVNDVRAPAPPDGAAAPP